MSPTSGQEAALDDAARFLFHRLTEYNLTQSLNGTQQGVTGFELGWHLSYDANPIRGGYGTLNNPAHALGGIQSMLRMPILGNRLSQVRFWRERGDDIAQYTIDDLRVAVAYARIIEDVLNLAFGG